MRTVYLFGALLVLLATVLGCAPEENKNETEVSSETSTSSNETTEVLLEEPEIEYTPDEDIQYYFDAGLSEKRVLIKATVIKNLPDDNDGSRHQKFLVELDSEQTLLIAHNIDLADRIDALEEGDVVIIAGQYEWNDRGGVVHWTHHDPDGIHPGGWIEHEGLRYE